MNVVLRTLRKERNVCYLMALIMAFISRGAELSKSMRHWTGDCGREVQR